MFEKWTDKPRDHYGCKEVPNIRLSLVDNDEIKYVMILDGLTEHDFSFGTEHRVLEFAVSVINYEDYTALVSKEYQKYIIETQQYWRSVEDGKDYLIELPAQVFHKMDYVRYKTDCLDGDPVQWEFRFSEWVDDDY